MLPSPTSYDIISFSADLVFSGAYHTFENESTRNTGK